MTTLGSTAEPTTSQVWYGLNSTNHHAIALTLPAGGPWNIVGLGAWVAGMNETSNLRLCLWTSGGSLVRNGPLRSLAGLAFAIGNNTKVEDDITAYEVPGGTTVHVGFARDPQDNTQFGTRSGTRKEWTDSTYPEDFGSWSSVSGAIGAWLVYETANTAPNAPTSLSPTGNAVVNSGTAPTVSGTRSDPDSGDYITAYQIVVYEDNGTTVIQDTGKISVGGTPTTFSRALALNGAHKYVKWKARTWDKEGVAGPYSAQQRFYANAVPSTPGAPTVDLDDLTPDISGTFSDSGDTLAAVQIEVTLSASPNTSYWSSGDLAKSGTSWTATYAGTALAWGTAYRARYRVKDSHGAYSAWSSWKTFTPVQPVGPDNMTPRTVTPRLTDLTPDLTVGHLGYQFKNHEILVRSVGSDSGGSTLWAPVVGADYALTNSKVATYAGTALTNGQSLFWKARIKDNANTWSAWSPYFELRTNAAPNIPTGLSPANGAVVPTLTPDLLATFSDPDAGDTPLNADIEVQRVSDSAAMWTQTNVTSLNDGVVTYAGTALAWETQYRWRVRFADQSGLEGTYSAWNTFKTSQPPVAAGVSPTGGAAVTESTPTLDWTFTSPGGKAQYSFQIRVYDKGPTGANYPDELLIHDSGEHISAVTQYDVPYGTLLDDHDYRWSVTVKDTDMLTHELT